MDYSKHDCCVEIVCLLRAESSGSRFIARLNTGLFASRSSAVFVSLREGPTQIAQHVAPQAEGEQRAKITHETKVYPARFGYVVVDVSRIAR